jgi:hypothetical protein
VIIAGNFPYTGAIGQGHVEMQIANFGIALRSIPHTILIVSDSRCGLVPVWLSVYFPFLGLSDAVNRVHCLTGQYLWLPLQIISLKWSNSDAIKVAFATTLPKISNHV